MAFDFPANPAVDEIFSSGGANYKWNGFAWGRQLTATPVVVDYVDTTGDTMTGALVLPGPPTQPNEAATKAYVDSVALPTGGTVGQVLAISTTSLAAWGAPADGGNF